MLSALKELDFDDFSGPLEEFLERYRQDAENKKTPKSKGKNDEEGDVGEHEVSS